MKALFIIILSTLFCFPLTAQNNDWIIQTNTPLVLNDYKNAHQGITLETLCETLNIYRLQHNESITQEEALQLLQIERKLQHISPNLTLEKRMIPNDALYTDQYHLRMIEMERVWQETTGISPEPGFEPVIALLDEGFDSRHEDFESNIWLNEAEIPNDGIDNDNNTFIDDYRGINVQLKNDEHILDTHGTQVAGIMSARGNNTIGIAGVSWNTKMLLISGVTNIAEIISGFDYTYNLKKLYIDSNGQRGANIVVSNFSGGLSRFFPEDFPAWCSMYDLMGSVGILSVGAVANEGFDASIVGDLPTLCTSPHLITVTNNNQNDQLVADAAFNAEHVDISAPGENIISTDINNTYKSITGTSASTPQVAAVAALLYTLDCEDIVDLSQNDPENFALRVKDAIMKSVDKNSSYEPTVSKGRINAYNALLELADVCGQVEQGALSLDNMYPNPIRNSEDLIIEYTTDNSNLHTLNIFNVVGQRVYTESFTPSIFSLKQIRLPRGFQELAEGLYWVEISNENDKSAKKLMFMNWK